MEKLEDIIVMKAGPHSDMSLAEIIESKNLRMYKAFSFQSKQMFWKK